MQRSSIKQIGSAIDELVSNLGIRKKLQEYDAIVYWESAVGERISKIAKPVRIIKGVLFVQVKTSVWRNELALSKKEILKKLNNKIGIDIVKDIKFQ